ncbi:MAG: ABC transporter substrate-binding protein [Salinigranum sp.]
MGSQNGNSSDGPATGGTEDERANGSNGGEGAATRGGRSSSTLSRRQVVRTAGLAGAFGLAGCLGSIGGGGADTLKIGVIAAMSHGWGSSGKALARGVQVYVDRVNENGDLNVETYVEDTEISPKTTAQKTKKLIKKNGVHAIIGPIGAVARDAAIPIASRNQVPLLNPTADEGPAADTYCNKWYFKSSEVPVQQINPLIPWLVDNYDGDRFYLIGDDYTWPHRINELVTKQVEANGGTIVGEQYVKLGTTDFTSIIPKIAEKKPDFLFSTATTGAGTLQKQIYNQGHKKDWTTIGLVFNQDLIAGLPPKAMTGQLSSHAYFEKLDNDVNKQMVSDFRSKYGEEAFINYLTGPANTAARFVVNAVKEKNSTDPADLRDGIRGASIDSPCGPVEMGHDQQMKVGCTVAEINDNLKLDPLKKFQAVMPKDSCENK